MVVACAAAGSRLYGPPAIYGPQCGNGQVSHLGGCATPEVSQRVFLYDVPPNPGPVYPASYPHPPK